MPHLIHHTPYYWLDCYVFQQPRIVSKRRANARVKAARSKAKAPPPGAKVNGRNIIHLLFEAVASTVHGLSFKGHHELWPDAVD
jgi:hypothetical protein